MGRGQFHEHCRVGHGLPLEVYSTMVYHRFDFTPRNRPTSSTLSDKGLARSRISRLCCTAVRYDVVMKLAVRLASPADTEARSNHTLITGRDLRASALDSLVWDAGP